MMEVRRYRTPDHDAVWELHNLALNDVGAHAGSGPWDDDLHRIEAAYLEAGGEFYVGTIDGRIVAMGALKRLTVTRAEICRMRVHPDHQRTGHGTRVLSKLEERARELGFRILTLDTTAGQTAAISMYTKAGYVEVARDRKLGFEVFAFEKRL